MLKAELFDKVEHRLFKSKLTDFNNFWPKKRLKKFTPEDCTFVHITYKMQLLYLGKIKTGHFQE